MMLSGRGDEFSSDVTGGGVLPPSTVFKMKRKNKKGGRRKSFVRQSRGAGERAKKVFGFLKQRWRLLPLPPSPSSSSYPDSP